MCLCPRQIFRSRAVSNVVKIKIDKTKVKPVVECGSETWAIAEMDMKRLVAGKRNILRIHGPVVQKGIWRIRTNHELRKLYKDLRIVAYINKK